jgi:hypothetical protein
MLRLPGERFVDVAGLEKPEKMLAKYKEFLKLK